MANKRIKDLGTTASTLAADDYVAIDGNANGTRKIVKGDLVNDISTQVAGTYLDEANNLSDVASKDTSKLNLEVPNVGVSPNEVPLSGQLGTMAFQDSAGVSVGQLSADGKTTLTNDSDNALVVETTNKNPMYVNVVGSAPNYLFDVRDDSTSKFRVDESGRVGIGSSPGSLNAAADDLVVGDGTGDRGISIFSNNASQGGIYFADGTTGSDQYAGGLIYYHNLNRLDFYTAGGHQWSIDSSGNLVANGSHDILIPDNAGAALEIKEGANPYLRFITTNGGEKIEVYKETHHSANIVMGNNLGIDFSATGDGSGTASSEVLSDYEEGTWTPVYTPTGGSFAAITMNVVAARYVKIGHQVTVNCYIQTTNLDTTGASGLVTVTGLPYANAGSNNYTAANIGYAIDWTEAPAGGHVSQGSSEIVLNKRFTSITGSLSSMSVSDLNTASGSKNTIMLTATYNSF
jgi:hypothetical protein